MESNNPENKRNNYFQNKRKIFNPVSLRNNQNTIRKDENRDEEKGQSTKIDNPSIAEKWIARGTIALVIVTGILAWYTYKLFDEASTSSRFTNETHKSDSALSYRRFISDSTIQRQRFDSENVILGAQISNAKETFYLNKASLDSSIAVNKKVLEQQNISLEQTRTYFETENKPFLELQVPINIDTIGVNIPIFLSYKVRNFGRYPVKILIQNSVAILRYNTPPIDSILFISQKNAEANIGNYVNRYITYDSPLQENAQTPFKLDSSYYSLIMFKRMPIYYLGFIRYVNLATNQQKEYDYMVKITFLNNKFTENEFIVNDNKNIP